MGFRRWLDPPAVRERKRRNKAAGIHPAPSGVEWAWQYQSGAWFHWRSPRLCWWAPEC